MSNVMSYLLWWE